MPRRPTLDKAERALIRDYLATDTAGGPVRERVRKGLADKLDQLDNPVKRVGITAGQLLDEFRVILGARLVLPPSSAVGVYAQIARRAEQLGLSIAQWRAVAREAGARWRGPIRAESIVRQADVLMSDAPLEPSNSIGMARALEMGDE